MSVRSKVAVARALEVWRELETKVQGLDVGEQLDRQVLVQAIVESWGSLLTSDERLGYVVFTSIMLLIAEDLLPSEGLLELSDDYLARLLGGLRDGV